MSRSTSQAIDQAMAHSWETKVKFVHVNLSVEKQLLSQSGDNELPDSNSSLHLASGPVENVSNHFRDGEDDAHLLKAAHGNDLEWVRVVINADPGISLEDIEDQEPQRRKEHRRVPSTIAIEEVKVSVFHPLMSSYFPLLGLACSYSDVHQV